MGGYGSGRRGGGPTVQSAFRVEIDALRRDGLIRPGVRGGCVIRFSFTVRDSKLDDIRAVGLRPVDHDSIFAGRRHHYALSVGQGLADDAARRRVGFPLQSDPDAIDRQQPWLELNISRWWWWKKFRWLPENRERWQHRQKG